MDQMNQIDQVNNTQNYSYRPLDNGFEKASFVLGVASIITAFLGLGIIPMMVGGVAVILAVLSRGKGNMGSRAFRGFVCGIIGIVTNIILIAYIIGMFFTNATYREQINNTSKMLYGYTMEELIEESSGGQIRIKDYIRE